jgi:hypothetical protein
MGHDIYEAAAIFGVSVGQDSDFDPEDVDLGLVKHGLEKLNER